MKKLTWMACFAFALAACTNDKELYDAEAAARAAAEQEQQTVMDNAKKILGEDMDFSQEWTMIKNGTVTITAATNIDVAKVQILTASPFGNADGAKILNETGVKAGETVTLSYDAPAACQRLYAACVTAEGNYRIKGFNPGQEKVSFGTTTTAKKARAPRRDIAIASIKSVDSTYNHIRAARADQGDAALVLWKGSGWHDMYNNTSIDEIARKTVLEDFDEDEMADMKDIIYTYLPEKKDNRQRIADYDKYVKDTQYFTTTGGDDPVVITPVHCGAEWVGRMHIYYYYFNPADLEGMSEAEQENYIKGLPKYRCIETWQMYKNYSAAERQGLDMTHRMFTYTLAYFGEGQQARNTKGSYTFPAGYKIGFMMHLEYGNKIWNDASGNLYADGRYNHEINQWGQFAKAGMEPDENRACLFGANGKNYIGFEDGVDKDFNDMVFEIEGGVKIIDEQIDLDYNVYTYAFEDRRLGDYDLNDVVVKAQRINATQVKYSLEATGANDSLFLRGINGQVLNGNTEVHALFGLRDQGFVNTEEEKEHVAPVQEIIDVPITFSFANTETEIYIHNASQGYDVHVARAGEDPHAILIPYDFQYPQEHICVKDAFLQFNSWGANRVDSNDWYAHPEEGKVYTKSVFVSEADNQ